MTHTQKFIFNQLNREFTFGRGLTRQQHETRNRLLTIREKELKNLADKLSHWANRNSTR